jgi:hypothetical protein
VGVERRITPSFKFQKARRQSFNRRHVHAADQQVESLKPENSTAASADISLREANWRLPIEARKAGISVVAISWDQSENKLANPMPSTVRFSQPTPTKFRLVWSFEGAVTEGSLWNANCSSGRAKDETLSQLIGGAASRCSGTTSGDLLWMLFGPNGVHSMFAN